MHTPSEATITSLWTEPDQATILTQAGITTAIMSHQNNETSPERGCENEEIFGKKRKLNTGTSHPVAATTDTTLPTNSSNADITASRSALSNNAAIQEKWRKGLEPRLLARKELGLDRPTKKLLTSLLLTKSDATAREMLLKLRLGDALSPLERAYALRRTRGLYTVYKIHNSPHDLIANDVKFQLKDLLRTAPNYLARSVTLSGSKHTNGPATESFFSPSAALDGRQCRPDIWDIPLGELAPMIGYHLAWADRIQDEVLSWTDSWLFAIVHLYLRHLKGQGDAYLFCVDRRRAYKLPDQAGAQKQAEFFPALPLSNAVNLLDDPWSAFMQGNLVYRKFTHEYLTHGVVEYVKDDRLQPIPWEDLQKEIFILLPEMRVHQGMKAFGLYQVLLYLRRVNYDGPAHFIMESELDAAENLARLHARAFSVEHDLLLPPLAIFINYLTLRKRRSDDTLFQERVKRLGYTRLDLDDVLYKDYETLPNNLPERASFLDLMRNVQTIVGGPPLRRNVIITEDSVSGHKFLEAEKFSRTMARLSFDPSKEKKVQRNGREGPVYAGRRSCSYDCHCTIWEATRGVGKEALGGDDKSNHNHDFKKKVELDEADWASL